MRQLLIENNHKKQLLKRIGSEVWFKKSPKDFQPNKGILKEESNLFLDLFLIKDRERLRTVFIEDIF